MWLCEYFLGVLRRQSSALKSLFLFHTVPYISPLTVRFLICLKNISLIVELEKARLELEKLRRELVKDANWADGKRTIEHFVGGGRRGSRRVGAPCVWGGTRCRPGSADCGRQSGWGASLSIRVSTGPDHRWLDSRYSINISIWKVRYQWKPKLRSCTVRTICG